MPAVTLRSWPKALISEHSKKLVDQGYLIVSSDPIPPGGIESLRENLDAARQLAGLLLEKPDNAEEQADV